MKRKTSTKRGHVALFLFLTIKFRNSFFVLASPSYADFHNLLPFLNEVSVTGDAFRMIFWGLISVLRWLINGAETGINYLIMMPNHFFSSEQMTTLINTVNVIFLAFIPLSLMWVGYKIIYEGAKGADIFKKAIKAISLSLGVMVGATWILTTGMNLVARSTGALNEMVSDSGNTLMDVKILNALLDLEYAYHFGASFTTESREMLNNLQSIDLDYLNFNENADRNVFTHTAVWNGDTYQFTELSSGRVGIWTIDMFVGYVYRFQVINWPALLIQLFVVAASFFLTGVKFARLLFELAYKRLITNLIAVLSFSNVSKMKKLISDVGHTLLALFLIVLFFRMYGDFLVWLNTLSVHLFVYLFLMIGASLSLLDGPVFVQKLTGVDVGISSDGLKAVLITGRLISETGNMFRPASKVVATPSGFADEVADEFKATKADVQAHLQNGESLPSKQFAGHDFEANKRDGYSQKSVEFDDFSSAHPTADFNQSQYEKEGRTQKNVPKLTPPNLESAQSGNHKNSYMTEHLNITTNQNASITNSPYVNEHQNYINQKSYLDQNQMTSTVQQQIHAYTPRSSNLKVPKFEIRMANDLNERAITDLMFPTKVPSNEATQMPVSTSNSFNHSNTNQSKPSFGEGSISKQSTKTADGLWEQNIESVNRRPLEQTAIGIKDEIRKEDTHVSNTKRNTKCNQIRS